MAAQLGFRSVIPFISAAILMLTASVGTAVADGPGGGANNMDPDSYIPPGSAEEAAYDAKLAGAATYQAAEAAWSTGASVYISPNGPEPIDPPEVATLDTRSRSQDNSYYCGPASGQVAINYTRDYFYDSLNGESTSTNYKTQSTIATKMGTDSGGTYGSGVVDGLDAYATYPSGFVYEYKAPADGSEFHSWIVYDVGGYSMPLIPSLIPHDQGAAYYLPNWPQVMTIAHFVVIRGYNGFWDGTNTPDVYYNDSASPSGPGRYSTGAKTMWKVTSYFVGKVVW